MASHVKVVGVLHDDNGRINGVKAKDLLTDEEFEIKVCWLRNS